MSAIVGNVGGPRHETRPGAAGAVPPRSRLFSLLRLETQSMVVIGVHASAVGVLSLATPLGVQALVSATAFGGLRQPLVVLAVLVFMLVGLASVFRALQWLVVERIQERVFVRAALEVSHRLPYADVGAFFPKGAHNSNRFLDVVTIQKGAATLLVDGTQLALQTIVGALVLAFYHPFLLAYAFVLITVAVLVVALPASRGTTTAVAESKAKYDVVRWLDDMGEHPTAFRSLEGERFATERAESLTKAYLASRRAHFRVVFRQGTTFFGLQAVAMGALLGLGGLLVLSGQITLGQWVAAELIVGGLAAAFSKLGKYLESYYDLLAALDKVGNLMEVPVENAIESTSAFALDGRALLVRMENVEFAGPGARSLSGIRLQLAAGDRISIVGPHGAGKSTLLDLIWGLRKPTRGMFELHGLPARTVDLREHRSRFALVRGYDLFDGTLLENIQVGRAEVGAQEVRAALEAVGLWDDIHRLPEGLGTSARHAPLSGGQVRRILVARAIAGIPSVVLIDGTLDGIDAHSRAALAGIFSSEAPWAIVLATHDPDVASLAATPYAMRDGTLESLSRNSEVPS